MPQLNFMMARIFAKEFSTFLSFPWMFSNCNIQNNNLFCYKVIANYGLQKSTIIKSRQRKNGTKSVDRGISFASIKYTWYLICHFQNHQQHYCDIVSQTYKLNSNVSFDVKLGIRVIMMCQHATFWNFHHQSEPKIFDSVNESHCSASLKVMCGGNIWSKSQLMI